MNELKFFWFFFFLLLASSFFFAPFRVSSSSFAYSWWCFFVFFFFDSRIFLLHLGSHIGNDSFRCFISCSFLRILFSGLFMMMPRKHHPKSPCMREKESLLMLVSNSSSVVFLIFIIAIIRSPTVTWFLYINFATCVHSTQAYKHRHPHRLRRLRNKYNMYICFHVFQASTKSKEKMWSEATTNLFGFHSIRHHHSRRLSYIILRFLFWGYRVHNNNNDMTPSPNGT